MKEVDSKKFCKICGKDFCPKGYQKTCDKECGDINRKSNHLRNSKIYVERHPERRKETIRKYSRENAEILNIKSRQWAKLHPESRREAVKRWRRENRKKRNAEAMAQRNISLSEKQNCERCKIKKAKHRHHEDYDKPLEVTFLCPKCHKLIHSEKGKKEVKK